MVGGLFLFNRAAHLSCAIPRRTVDCSLHFAVNFLCPVLSRLGLILFPGHVGKVGHAAEARIRRGRGPQAVVPFALGVADGGDVAR